MANDKIPGREQQPIAGATKYVLNGVKLPDNSKTTKDPKTQDVIDKIVKCFEDGAKYGKDISNAQATSLIFQIRALLNQLNSQQIQPAIEQIKEEVSSTSLKSIIGNMLMSQLTDLFDNDAKKDDIDELKQWMQDEFGKTLVEQTDKTAISQEELQKQLDESFADFGDVTAPISEAGEVPEDETNGDYQDSKPSQNFLTLQNFVDGQFDDLNKKLKNIPGQSGILSRISSKIGSVFRGLGRLTKGVMGGISNIMKKTIGVFGVVGSIASGIKHIGSGIKSIGSKVGGAIMSPFKKVGGFIKSLNPFKKSEEKAAERKKNAKEKIFDFMAKVLDKIWKVIEPFVNKVGFFMGIISKFVIIPIAIIMTKILLIVGAIIALGVAAYLVYSWVKEKISKFWDYLTSGEMLDDIIKGLKAAWEWLVDFGKWLWDITVKALKYIFWDMWIDLGKWIWKKLCEFGNWLYDNYIYKYLIKPFKEYIWEPIKKLWNETVWPMLEPFVDSLMNLYEKIKTAFSAWDTNKSIWENLKNISGIIKDSVMEWWENSPFKEFYDKYLDPIVKSLGNLVNRIKTIWNNFKWDENKSFLENLKGFASTIVQAVKDWWNDPENPIKATYNKYIKPIVDKISEKISPIIEKLKEIWNSLKIKLSKVYFHIPVWDKDIYPFAALVNEPFLRNGGESAADAKVRQDKEEIDDKLAKIAELKHSVANDRYVWSGEKGRQKDREEIARLEKEVADYKKSKEEPKRIAQQQVGQAMKPVDSINNMQTEGNVQLQQQGQQMSEHMQKQEEKRAKFDADQYSYMYQNNQALKDLRDDFNKYRNDPTVVTAPVVVNNSPRGAATMQSPYNNTNLAY